MIPRQLEGTGTGGRLPQAFSTADMAGEENLTFCPNLCRNSEYVQCFYATSARFFCPLYSLRINFQSARNNNTNDVPTLSGNSVLCVFPMVIVFVEMEAGSPLGDGGAGNRRPWCCIYAEEEGEEQRRALGCRRPKVTCTIQVTGQLPSWLTSRFRGLILLCC